MQDNAAAASRFSARLAEVRPPMNPGRYVPRTKSSRADVQATHYYDGRADR